MPLVLRPATRDDLNAMVDLLDMLFTQEADFVPNRRRQEAALLAILSSPVFGQLVVADSGTAVVGMVSVLFVVSTAEGGLAAWLEDMVVHPSHRRSGIGQQLLDEAITICRRKGIHRITLLTDASNEPAQRLYSRKGFVQSHMVPFRLRCLDEG